jgi:hypothetical protein
MKICIKMIQDKRSVDINIFIIVIGALIILCITIINQQNKSHQKEIKYIKKQTEIDIYNFLTR